MIPDYNNSFLLICTSPKSLNLINQIQPLLPRLIGTFTIFQIPSNLYSKENCYTITTRNNINLWLKLRLKLGTINGFTLSSVVRVNHGRKSKLRHMLPCVFSNDSIPLIARIHESLYLINLSVTKASRHAISNLVKRFQFDTVISTLRLNLVNDSGTLVNFVITKLKNIHMNMHWHCRHFSKFWEPQFLASCKTSRFLLSEVEKRVVLSGRIRHFTLSKCCFVFVCLYHPFHQHAFTLS